MSAANGPANVPPSAAGAIEDALWDAAGRHLPAHLVGGPALTAAVVDRSRRYTSDRERLAAPARGHAEADLAARALFFTVADAPKAAIILGELGDRVAWGGDAPLRVLDLGAGCGAMTLGALAHAAAVGATRPLVVDALDRDAGALAILRDAVPAAARALGLAATVATHAHTLTGGGLPVGAAYELILVGTMLNELAEPDAHAVVQGALARLAPGGALVIVEPALRDTTRALHRLRDAVITGGWAHVFAPCTRRAAPCPMLADARDWCHEDRPGALPPRATRLATVTGLRDGGLKYSYLVLRHAPGHVGAPGALRVIGQPHRSKGKLEAPACGEAGAVTLRLLSRHRGEAARAFDRARRGDVLVLDPAGPVEVRDNPPRDDGGGAGIERDTP